MSDYGHVASADQAGPDHRTIGPPSFVVEEPKPPPSADGDVEQYRRRGGWYHLPDGRKVHGRKAAMEAVDGR